MKQLIIGLLFLLIGCNNDPKAQSIIENSNKEKIWTIKDATYSYVVMIDSVLCGGTTGEYCLTVKTVDIYKLQNNKHIQTIIPEKFIFEIYCDSTIVFNVEDMNFDGYNDIRLLKWLSANLQISYLYWFFNKTTGQFESDTTLEKFSNPHFDQTKKTFHTWWRTGMTNYGHALYQWKNNKLQLISEEEESWDVNPANPGFLVFKRSINDTIVETEKLIKEQTIEYAHDRCPLY